MAKAIRSIKNDLCDDETLGSLSRDARYLFVGLITRADDHGRFRAHPALVRSRVLPYDSDVTDAMVASWLDELDIAGRIRRYRVDGQTYGLFVNWEKHQRIDNAAKSEFPDPDAPQSEILSLSDTYYIEAAASCGEPPQIAANLGENTALSGNPPLDRKGKEGIGEEGKTIAPMTARKTDDLFESVAEVCGIDWHELTASGRGPLNKAVSELRTAGADPPTVRDRALRYRELYSVPLTPMALTKHWASLDGSRMSANSVTGNQAVLARLAAGQ